MTMPSRFLLRRAIGLASPMSIPNSAVGCAIHTSAARCKTKRKTAAPATNNSPPSSSSPPNPLDLSDLEASWAPIDTQFRSELATVTTDRGLAELDRLRVTVKQSDGSCSTSFPLTQVAQVVPRPGGRTVSLLVNDRTYIKPVMSAVQNSNIFNQQPQRGEDDELELTVRLAPERKDDVVRRVRAAANEWRDKVRHERTRRDKLVRAWTRDGLVLNDVARRAEKEVQRAQDAKMRDIDAHEARAVASLDKR